MSSNFLNALAARRLAWPVRFALGASAMAAWTAPAEAQSIRFEPIEPAPGFGLVCTIGGFVTLHDNDDTCEPGSNVDVTKVTFSGGAVLALTGNGTSLSVTGGASSTLNGNTSMSGTQAFSGSSTFNSTVSFVGPAVTFSSGTTFGQASTFNALADFNNGITSNTITNSGTINTATLSAGTVVGTSLSTSGLLYAAPGANVDMGSNIIHFLAAGVADDDAVNVAQLNAATSGITTNVTELQTAVTDIQTVNSTQDTRLTSVETVNNMQDSRLTSAESINTAQSSQIGALQSGQDVLSGQVDTLFDLRGQDRRDMKEGIASAMAMAPAPMPSAPGKVAYAVNGAMFRGQYAVGGSLTYRLNSRSPTALNVGFSYAGNKNNGVRVGVAGEF